MIDLQFLSWKDFTAGWISGVCSISIGYPLETIKVRQQMDPKSGTASKQASQMLKKEGFHCFFKGLSYPLWSTGLLNSLYFGFYGNSLRMIEDLKGERNYRNCCEDGPVYKGWHLDCFLAGCIGGSAATLINTPIELVKTVLQANSNTFRTHNIVTPNACLQYLYKSRGIRGCFHGGVILFFRDVPTYGLYAIIYEHIACLLKQQNPTDKFTNIVYEGIAGGLSGVITWMLALPLDAIKSRYMSDCINHTRQYSSITDCILKIYQENGWRAFYRGFWIASIRAFPVNLICFVSYEQTLKLCSYL